MDEATPRELQVHLRALHAAFRRSVPPMDGVSRSAVRVLGVVARNDAGGGVRPGRLSDELGMATSNVAAALRELVEAGYVKRTRSAADGRLITVTLTDQGVSAVAEHRALRANSLRETIEAALTPAEQEQLTAAVPLLGKLAAAHPLSERP